MFAMGRMKIRPWQHYLLDVYTCKTESHQDDLVTNRLHFRYNDMLNLKVKRKCIVMR